ncbi:hypothetical protein [Radiobacillus deserti]|uniref:Uncharacterized protein n=1 Tax=Radiobacillus deserti TaxID=2594883 RepID=A0A516KEU9_9BACI|nr:hypothetical protein [Radiobacillus deserti]QDP39910.1 hypothetical protein FN924_06855 [Radiobacillus deserti]
MIFILLLLSISILVLSLRKMALIEMDGNKTVKEEMKQNTKVLALGAPIVAALIVIPYLAWNLFGKSKGWDGAYILLGTSIITIVSSFIFYYKFRKYLH